RVSAFPEALTCPDFGGRVKASRSPRPQPTWLSLLTHSSLRSRQSTSRPLAGQGRYKHSDYSRFLIGATPVCLLLYGRAQSSLPQKEKSTRPTAPTRTACCVCRGR